MEYVATRPIRTAIPRQSRGELIEIGLADKKDCTGLQQAVRTTGRCSIGVIGESRTARRSRIALYVDVVLDGKGNAVKGQGFPLGAQPLQRSCSNLQIFGRYAKNPNRGISLQSGLMRLGRFRRGFLQAIRPPLDRGEQDSSCSGLSKPRISVVYLKRTSKRPNHAKHEMEKSRQQKRCQDPMRRSNLTSHQLSQLFIMLARKVTLEQLRTEQGFFELEVYLPSESRCLICGSSNMP